MNVTPPTSEQQSDELAPIYQSAINVLNLGFRTGAALLVVGLVVAAAKRESIPHEVDPFDEIFPKIFDGEAAGIIDLAIIAIMVTPLATVITVAIGFERAGDRRFALISLLVLGILCISVALSLLR